MYNIIFEVISEIIHLQKNEIILLSISYKSQIDLLFDFDRNNWSPKYITFNYLPFLIFATMTAQLLRSSTDTS